MAAVLKILGWKTEGLRCPDHEINCCSQDGTIYPVTLVQMPNGTGKTTTLELLRTALSGTGKSWNRRKVKEFRKRGSAEDYGVFEVRLLLNDRQFTVRLEFNFDNERLYYKTTYGAGQRDGFHPPPDFIRFLHENFINFFVFDGELAQHLLTSGYSDAESVVETLFQINSFTLLTNRISEYWESQAQRTGASEEKGLSRRRNRLKTLKERLQTLEKDQAALIKSRDEISARLNEKNEQYEQEIKKNEDRSRELKEAETKLDRKKAEVREKALDILETMRDPFAISPVFAQSMMDLKTGLDRVELPESAAREFFEGLAKEDICVCGREIDDEIRDTIRERASHYLGSEDVAFLNSMKTSIQDVLGTSIHEPSENLNTKIETLSEASGKEREAKNDLEHLKLQAAQADPAVEKAQEEINALNQELSALNTELEKFDSKDKEQGDERTFGIEVIKERISTAERKLAEISDTMELKEKRDILARILKSAHSIAKKSITEEICDDANSRISEILPDNNISIDRIDQCLHLNGQEGGSVGETLSVAWAFLATLFYRSEHHLPFVVDSPAGSIDLSVRPKIGELIPKLTDQFIAFTISSERERFVTPLKQASENGVHFITLFRKRSQSLIDEAKQQTTFTETSDGMKVVGEEFFSGFQLESEETA